MAAWPAVKSWLLDAFAGLPSMSSGAVFNGPPVARTTPTVFVSVGFVEDDNGGTFSQQADYDGTAWTEVGEVRSKIVANSGNSDPSTAEAVAFAVADEITAVVQADQTLAGTLSPEATVFCSVDILTISNGRGTATELLHVLRYTTTTT